ncbi:hypothetical protein [Pseudomonas soli]|uniref:hypothetical protein n=1 Tax=Pseudomonas soli TaxID=1306993 RepID=UPI00345D2452
MNVQHTTHAKLTTILGHEPWTLPSNETTAPRVSDLLKTMSQRAAAEHLGISRRQLAKLVIKEAQEDSEQFPIHDPESASSGTEPTMTRAGALASLQVIAASAAGLTSGVLREHGAAVYGRDADGRSLATASQIKTLKSRALADGGVFAPKWMDVDRAKSQRLAMLAVVSDLQDRITETTFELVAKFPGADFKALQDELIGLLAPTSMPVEARLANLESAAETVDARRADLGPVKGAHLDDAAWHAEQAAMAPEWDRLCL